MSQSFYSIPQITEVMKDEQEKWVWLRQRLVEFTSHGSVLVFVTRKVNSEEVATSLRGEGHGGMWVWLVGGASCMTTPLPPVVGLLHGDMTQGDRDSVIGAFKKRDFPTLVATDVAGEQGVFPTLGGCLPMVPGTHGEQDPTLVVPGSDVQGIFPW